MGRGLRLMLRELVVGFQSRTTAHSAEAFAGAESPGVVERRFQPNRRAAPDRSGGRTLGDHLFRTVQKTVARHRGGASNSCTDGGLR
jgi:hypothetical protein